MPQLYLLQISIIASNSHNYISVKSIDKNAALGSIDIFLYIIIAAAVVDGDNDGTWEVWRKIKREICNGSTLI